jgi:cation diffusion facilitator family transporter
MTAQSRRTVLVALASNSIITVAKIAAGVLSGSTAMLAEGAHSVADTANELFLLRSLQRSKKPADDTHPFGYGKERFFWSLLAAVGIFVSGAVFSLYEGITGLISGERAGGSPLVSYVVLAIAFLTEGTSWLTAVRQLHGESRSANRTFVEHVKRSSDSTVKTVISEDSAALVGLVLAGGGIALRQITGAPQWDAGAAVAIGLLLTYVAFRLGHDTKELLIGEAADPELRAQLWRELVAFPEVDAVVELLTMKLGPTDLLVAVRLDLAGGLDSDTVETVSARIDAQLQDRYPDVTHVFLDATRASGGQRSRSERIANG